MLEISIQFFQGHPLHLVTKPLIPIKVSPSPFIASPMINYSHTPSSFSFLLHGMRSQQRIHICLYHYQDCCCVKTSHSTCVLHMDSLIYPASPVALAARSKSSCFRNKSSALLCTCQKSQGGDATRRICLSSLCD